VLLGRRTYQQFAKIWSSQGSNELPSFDRRVPVTATNAWPNFHRRDGSEVDKQVAAPTETRTPNWHRANIAQQRVRMEGWRQRRSTRAK
jgi:hypothetical protein